MAVQARFVRFRQGKTVAVGCVAVRSGPVGSNKAVMVGCFKDRSGLACCAEAVEDWHGEIWSLLVWLGESVMVRPV